MILYIVAIVVVLVMCWFLSRFVAKKLNNNVAQGSYIKVIERVALGQDKGLAICKVCERYYLVGIAAQNVKILAELDPQLFVENKNSAGAFREMMDKALKKNNA